MRTKIISALCAAIVATGCTTAQRQCTNGAVFIAPDAPGQFAAALLAQAADDDANTCLSPLSAQWALAMTANGAAGATAEQIYKALGCGEGAKARDAFNRLQQDKIDAIRASEGAVVKTANSIWINSRIKVKSAFIDANKKYYGATVENSAFDDAATRRINSWCSENTGGKIKSILDKADPNTQMLLLNALYFNAKWGKPFNRELTKQRPFTTADGTTADVPTMIQNELSPYHEDSIMQATIKPFAGGEYAMLLALPKEGKSIKSAAEHLGRIYNKEFGSKERYTVLLEMPRFKCEYGTSLKKALTDMGITEAFGERADFGDISKTPLRIDDVIQKCYISVDEAGAEAAAVTAVQMVALSMAPRKRASIILNRPFIYAIVNQNSGDILFIGNINNPEK